MQQGDEPDDQESQVDAEFGEVNCSVRPLAASVLDLNLAEGQEYNEYKSEQQEDNRLHFVERHLAADVANVLGQRLVVHLRVLVVGVFEFNERLHHLAILLDQKRPRQRLKKLALVSLHLSHEG